MATTRVHILAKELNVKSKAIVEKCQAEGLDIKNHMATISAGLAATIREWFSEGEHATTVETTDRVNLKKVRIKKKKVVEKKKEEPKDTPAEVVTEDAATIPLEPAATAVVEQAPPEVIEPEPEPEPEPIMPAGPMLEKPEPAKLSGPTVIRVEKVEPERRPLRTPRPKARPRYDAPVVEDLLSGSDLETKDKDKDKDKKSGKHKTHGRRHDETPADFEIRRARRSRRLRDRDMEERRARLDAAGGEGMRLRPNRKIEAKSRFAESLSPVRPEKATVSEPVMARELAAAIGVKVTDIIGRLMAQGVMAGANQSIANDAAELVALEFGVELTVERKQLMGEKIATEFDSRLCEKLEKRPPVVTMLGHVDHGKTSLLDRIRSAQVADGEAGGITQHIGAYQVVLGSKVVTFLDTPGHEAFTAMRARGANMTDIVVLVVAADDGVMPQTVEAIHHAKAAGVKLIIALNKIDLPGVDLNRIYGQFAENELTVTEWGGDVDIVKTSAVTGEGVEDLIEHLDYAADLLELKADNSVDATGWIVEAKMSQTQGPVATLLIKEGMLSKGDVVLAGCACGRVRSMVDGNGKSIKKATSSMPVEISGLNEVPQAGDRFFKLKDINRAKEAAEDDRSRNREDALASRSQVTLENLFTQIEAGKIKEVNVILRADVQGSVDVLLKYLTELNTDEVQVKILHAAVGGITEGDVVLADASSAIIIGFNVVPEEQAAKTAEEKRIDIRLYNVIYRITEDLKKAMVGLLEPEEQEKHLGKLTVRNTFKITGAGTVAGCFVNEGPVPRTAKLRLIRNNIVVKDNCAIESLKHFKDDVREVRAGLECGLKIAGYDDIKVDDAFEAYEIVQIARTL